MCMHQADLATERERHLTTGKRAKRTKLAFRFPISRSTIGQVACVASVSVRFRRKERGTRVKDREKSGASKRTGRGWVLPPLSLFGSRFISRAVKTESPLPRYFFAPKPNGNACYAGYWSSQLFDLCAPSSNGVRVLLLNQPIMVLCIKGFIIHYVGKFSRKTMKKHIKGALSQLSLFLFIMPITRRYPRVLNTFFGRREFPYLKLGFGILKRNHGYIRD